MKKELELNSSKSAEKKSQHSKISTQSKVPKLSHSKKSFLYVGIILNILLIISSYWFNYKSFLFPTIAVTILLFIIAYFTPTSSNNQQQTQSTPILIIISYIILILLYIFFIMINYNYIFIFGFLAILAIGITNFTIVELNVPEFIYSLIPLLILIHVIWFNILPFGIDTEYKLDVAGPVSIISRPDIYLIDDNNVLSPDQSYGKRTWKSFRKDGTIQIGFTSPIELRNKTVEVDIKYASDGQIYINNELLYDSLWGSSVNIATFENEYVYGDKDFNITPINQPIINQSTNLTTSELISQEQDKTLKNYLAQKLLKENDPNNQNIQYNISDEYETLDEFIRASFQQGVLLKDFTGNYQTLEHDMKELYYNSINSVEYYTNYSQEPHNSNLYFRGETKFQGIFKDNIEISFDKQDMNLYFGNDSVEIIVKNFNNEIIATSVIKDNDGVDNRTTEESEIIRYSYTLPINQSGIYKLEFKHFQESEDPDFIIGNFTFNTNKVIIDGDFLLWSSGKLYNNPTNKNNTIRVRYWWSGYDQLITFNDKTSFDLSEELKGSWVEISLIDKTSLEFEKGTLMAMPKQNLDLFPNSNIPTSFVEKVQITKSLDLEKENINLQQVDQINITATKGTEIEAITIKLK